MTGSSEPPEVPPILAQKLRNLPPEQLATILTEQDKTK